MSSRGASVESGAEGSAEVARSPRRCKRGRDPGAAAERASEALEPLAAQVRTLDALHLASIEFLRGRGQKVELASYDDRLLAAARALGIPIVAL